jgi:uncharacterized DUF497 family protein
MEFEWDAKKEQANIKKHSVSFAESVDTFFDCKGIQLTDESHSNLEKRFYWIGKSKSGRILTTYFTHRGDKVRIIGCAEWRKFRRIYLEAAKNE